MKKQFLSLLLVVLFIPSIFVFAGCKDKSYKLSNLEGDYKNIVSGCENIKMEGNKIVFDYSSHKIGDIAYMDSVLNLEPYNQLENYNLLFDNLMGFVYEYISVCSSDNIEVDADTRNKLKTELNNLSLSINSVDIYINQFAEIIEFNYNENVITDICLARYKNLLFEYNNLYQTTINFSNSLASLYYNNALYDSNPRIDSISLENFDSSVVISKLQGRVKYQVSNLSQIFVEKYIDGQGIEEVIITDNEGVFGKLDLSKDNYLSNVNNIERVFNSSFDAESAVIIANSESKKQTFYNLAVQAYNLQNILDNDNYMFVQACNAIQYGKVGNNKSKDIINNYNYAVQKYNDVLVGMLNCLSL